MVAIYQRLLLCSSTVSRSPLVYSRIYFQNSGQAKTQVFLLRFKSSSESESLPIKKTRKYTRRDSKLKEAPKSVPNTKNDERMTNDDSNLFTQKSDIVKLVKDESSASALKCSQEFANNEFDTCASQSHRGIIGKELDIGSRNTLDSNDDVNSQTYKALSLAEKILEFERVKNSASSHGVGGKDDVKYVSSAMKKQERISKFTFWIFILGSTVLAAYNCRNFNLEESKKFGTIEGYSPRNCFNRFKSRWSGFLSKYQDPVFEKLLPDPLPEPYGRNLTLVLDLEDLLVHSDWSREHGWRTAKRPGLDYFLGYLSQYYEIIIFTDQYMSSIFNIIQKLDPYRNIIHGALFHEAMKYENGKYIKDISYLNRPLEKVIMIDTKPDSWSKQPDNAIKMAPWKGNSDDNDLVGLLSFLEYLACMNVQDVRPILKSFDGKHIPTEYAKREQALRDQTRKNWEEDLRRKPTGLGRIFGFRPTDMTGGPPPLLIDQQRQVAQKSYAEMLKYLKENGEEILKTEKARDEEAANEFKANLFGMFYPKNTDDSNNKQVAV